MSGLETCQQVLERPCGHLRTLRWWTLQRRGPSNRPASWRGL